MGLFEAYGSGRQLLLFEYMELWGKCVLSNIYVIYMFCFAECWARAFSRCLVRS